MINQIVAVGRLKDEFEIRESENGKKYAKFTLEIPRPFRNPEGVYGKDYVDFVVWDSVAQRMKDYCRPGDIVGIRGRVQSSTYKDKEGVEHSNLSLVGEKVTFVSSKELNNENKQDREER